MNVLFDMFSHHNKALATVTGVLIVCLMAASLAQGVVFFFENMQEVQFITANSADNSLVQNRRTSNLAKLDIFGKSEEEKVLTKNVDLPTTSLNLELRGVFAAENPAESGAIVAQKGKTGELFYIGDRLPGNAILNAVLDDHILIKRGSRLEKLPFPDSSSIPSFSASTNRSSTTRAATTRRATSTRLQQVQERIARRSQQRGLSSTQGADFRSRLSAYKKRLSSDPQGVLKELGITAVTGSESSGYRIGAEVSESILRQAGLRKGDVIISVNGKPVNEIVNSQTLIDQAMRLDLVRVEIQRDERRFFISVPVKR